MDKYQLLKLSIFRANIVATVNLLIFLLQFFLLCKSSSTTTTVKTSSIYYLNGVNSYAKYAHWQPCLNDTLEFEFKTNETNCLIFYTQNTPYTYIQVYLNNGYLHMKFRINENDDPDGIYLEHNYIRLNDDKWHHVIIKRLVEYTRLIIDNDRIFTHKHRYINKFNQLNAANTASLNGNDNPYSDFETKLFLFGGLPDYIQTYDLSSSTVLFEKRFNGFIRNARLVNCTLDYMIKLEVIESNGLNYFNDIDKCMSNPCLNNGICLLNDEGFYCDCSYINYEGKFCEKCK